MRFLATAWWVLWHPVQSLLIAFFALLWMVAPELALVVAIIWWYGDLQRRSRRAQLEARAAIRGEGFTMREPD